MLLYNIRQKDRFEDIENAACRPNHTFGSPASISHLKLIPSIDTFRSKLSIKSSNVPCLYFEIVNGLNVANSAWKSSYKYCRLRQLRRKYAVDLIGLVEAQINSELLSRGKDVKENLFRPDINNHIFTKNANELIDFRQEGRDFFSVRGGLARFARASRVDKSHLDRWTWMELHFYERKIRLVTAQN